MQIPTDAEFAAAVEAAERAPRAQLTADWGRDGSFSHALANLSTVVDDITVERSLTGDLPNETTLVEGYASARLTAHLSGQRAEDPRDIARLLSPFRADSPLARQPPVGIPVRWDIGLATASGTRLLRQFTGATRRIDLSAAGRMIEIEALDAAERLRVAVTLPLFAKLVDAYYNRVDQPYIAYTNTQWVIDYVLRRNGIYFSPPPRSGCIFALTGHGSLAPDVGRGTRAIPGRNTNNSPSFIPGRYGLAINGSPQITGGAKYYTSGGVFTITSGHVIEFYVRAGGANTFPPGVTEALPITIASSRYRQDGTSIALHITTTGQLLARIYSSNTLTGTLTGPKINGPAAWHSVGLWLDYDRNTDVLSSRWHLDGILTPFQAATHDIITTAAGFRSEVVVASHLPLQCIQLSSAPEPPGNWGTEHVSQCDLDTGLNWIVGLPDIVNADSWEVIKTAAAAEYGLVGFGEDGRFSFRNRDTVRQQQAAAPGRTLTAAVSLSDLRVSTSIDSVRNEVAATTTPRLETLIPVIAWQATTPDEFNVAANAILERVVSMGRRAKVPSADLLSYHPNDWSDTFPTWGYCATNLNTGAYVTANVTVRIVASDNEMDLTITIVNRNTFPIRFAVGNRAALRIQADDVFEDRKTASFWTNPASAQKWGRRVLSLPDNPFRQLPAPVGAVATSLLTDLAEPAPVLAEVPVTGDPRTQLGDLVTIHDPDGLGGPIKGSVIGIRRTLSTTGGLADFLTVRATST